jgi:hypothetical protein
MVEAYDSSVDHLEKRVVEVEDERDKSYKFNIGFILTILMLL